MLNELARAALNRRSLELRQYAQDLLVHFADLAVIPEPLFDSVAHKTVAAAILELLAERRGQLSPAWTQSAVVLPVPFYLLESALTMPRLRQLCETESPLPLRKRGLFAPPQFLEFA